MVTSLDETAGTDRRIRACRLSRRAGDLITIAHASPQRIAAMPMQELLAWADGLALALRRERVRSMARHWSYDINRHIALKRARDRVKAEIASRSGNGMPAKAKAAD